MEDKKIFKEAARERLEDAYILGKEGRIHIAFYLLGYCIECGIKYFIIKSLDCKNIKEAEQKVGKLYYHIDKMGDKIDDIGNRKPILCRRMDILNTQIRKRNPRISRKNREFQPIFQGLRKLLKKFYENYGWKIELRYTSEYSLHNRNYPQGYNFNYIKSNFENIIKEVWEVVWKL